VRTAPLPAHDVAEIVRRNVFCSGCRATTMAGSEHDGPAATPPLRLVAGMWAAAPKDASRSIAIIKDEGGVAGAYTIGSRLGSAVVEEIDATRVFLRLGGGERQALSLLDGAPPVRAFRDRTEHPAADPLTAELDAGLEQRGERSYAVRRATLESLLGKIDTLPPQARLEADLREGKPIGFRLRDVRDDGVLARLGLRDGDLISSVNGLPTNGPDSALAIYASLRSADHVSVGLERAGRRLTAEYDIE